MNVIPISGAKITSAIWGPYEEYMITGHEDGRICHYDIKVNIIAFCIRVRTSLIFSSVKLLQSKTQSLLPGVGGVSMVISCQNYTHYLPMALMFVYKGHV